MIMNGSKKGGTSEQCLLIFTHQDSILNKEGRILPENVGERGHAIYFIHNGKGRGTSIVVVIDGRKAK